jgi:predicted enzyme related to lactoylglutathione lyase
MQLLINIDVDDLEAGVQFYREALGLRVGRRLGVGFVELLGGSSPIYLLQKQSGSETSSLSGERRDYARHWTPVHLDFVVDDLEMAITRALIAGAKLEAPFTIEVYGKLALLSDPWGHGFCLLQFTGRGYDEIAETL